MRILVSGATATLRRLAPKYADNLGILLTPANGNAIESIIASELPWAVDNGAFSGFRETEFEKLLDAIVGKPRLLWVAAPDQVGDADRTLLAFRQWCGRIKRRNLPVAFVLQDGCDQFELPEADAYFVGGSTRFKLSQEASDMIQIAKLLGKPVHMGRVNTLNRLTAALQMGCDSIDGTGFSRFADTYLERGVQHIRNHLSQSKLITEAAPGDGGSWW